ncbi:MAG: hypothetical protein M3540_12710 [Actinomycetota bacterium]|nr:hypothetical protein [Actinomycetota bacterium]
MILVGLTPTESVESNIAHEPSRISWTRKGLILGGAAVIAVALALAALVTRTTRSETRASGGATRVTETEAPFSDTLIVAVLGIGGLLILSGAFYSRIAKVTFPGGGAIEMALYPQAATAVNRVLEQSPGGQAPSPAKTAAATSLAAVRAADLTRRAATDPAVAATLAEKGGLTTTEWWDELVKVALVDVGESRIIANEP